MAPPLFVAMLAEAGMHSPYQQLKNTILSVVGLSKDAVHLYIGIGCFLLSVLLLRMPPNGYRALILGVLVSLGMEALDLRDNVRYRETTRAMASLHDLMNTNLLAFLVVVTMRLRLGAPAKRGKRAKGA
jgi:hypothetical protein